MYTNHKESISHEDVKADINKLKGEIILDEKKCRGCNTCMLACSFHHSSVFSKELSSIKVRLDYITGSVNWMVSTSCDLCKCEKEILCIKHCPYDCLSLDKF